MMNHLASRGIYLALTMAFLFIGIFVPIASAQTDIYKVLETPFYDPNDSGDSSLFCLGGPGGSGPLYGPEFPKVDDTAALSAAIKTYINNTLPSSPLVAYADAYVGFGIKYNVNPALVVTITQKETSLATAGYGKPPKYNVGNIRGGSDSTGFASYAGYSDGLEAIYKDLRSGLYLDPPAGDTTVAEVMNTYAPPSENDTAGYIQFIGDIMKKILNGLGGSSADSTLDSCTFGSASGPVEEGSNADLANKILKYRSGGQYNCDNSGDCADLTKIINGQSLAGSEGCRAQTLDPRVLKLILYMIEVGKFQIGTYALCGDHSFDSTGGHSGGFAVDISSVNGAVLGSDTPQAGNEGLKLDKFLNNLPNELKLDQQISYGYGGHYDAQMAATQQAQGKLCGSSCVSFYGLDTELVHQNHIHAGF